MRWEKTENISQKFFTVCLAWYLFSRGVLLFGTSAKATGDVTRYRTAYLQNCCPGIQVVAHAYLVGNDNVANYWKTIAVDKVPVNTKIQGRRLTRNIFRRIILRI